MTEQVQTSPQLAAAEAVALVEAIANKRNREAFASLFEYYAPRLKAYLRRLSSDESIAEELVQDVMLTVWRKAEQFNSNKSAVSTWLFTIARNRWIDTLRRDRSSEMDLSDPSVQPDQPEQPDEIYDIDQRAERLRAALEELPSEQVELIKLSFFSGNSHSAIAEKTGLPLGTVKSRMRLAFTKLRGTLEGKV